MLFRTRHCYCSHARLCELFPSCKTFVPELPSALALVRRPALECSFFLLRYLFVVGDPMRDAKTNRREKKTPKAALYLPIYITGFYSRNPISCKNEKGRLRVRFVLRVVFVKARRTLFKSREDGARVVGSFLKDFISSFKRPLKKVKREDLSDTGYGVDQNLVPFAHVPTVDVIVRALRDGQHVVLIHLFG